MYMKSSYNVFQNRSHFQKIFFFKRNVINNIFNYHLHRLTFFNNVAETNSI